LLSFENIEILSVIFQRKTIQLIGKRIKGRVINQKIILKIINSHFSGRGKNKET